VHSTGATDDRQGRAKAGELNLYGVAERIEQPYLAIAGRLDRLVPWEQTKRQADEAPGGEFVVFEAGGHVCSNIPYLYRPLAADWLGERLS
jgi:2,6-dihydroxypseudooxynicotine hydrolase